MLSANVIGSSRLRIIRKVLHSKVRATLIIHSIFDKAAQVQQRHLTGYLIKAWLAGMLS